MVAHNFKDLTGQTYQYLTVIGRAEDAVYKNGKIKVRWLCKCVCGKEVFKYANDLKKKDKVVSCGCKTPKPGPKYDLTGNEVGFLKVLGQSSQKGIRRDFLWECLCECGNKLLVSGAMLRKAEKKSCGCKSKAETSGTHGLHGTGTWKTWSSMIQRCTKEYHKSYEKYKDIPVDPAWLESFESFYEDMGNRPDGMSLDRIDNDKGYFKDNCRWATHSQQQQNKKPNHINKIKGLAGVGISGNKYCARIRHDGIREFLGPFDTPEEANEAYNKRGQELFGDEWVYKGAKE